MTYTLPASKGRPELQSWLIVKHYLELCRQLLQKTAGNMHLVASDVISRLLANCGHFVVEKAPEALVAAVQTFLKLCGAGRA